MVRTICQYWNPLGLGIACRAHSVVQEAMDVVLNHSGLDTLNDFLGWINGSEYGW
jgi:hypothetical protein